MHLLSKNFNQIINWIIFGRSTNAPLKEDYDKPRALCDREKRINVYRISELNKTRWYIKLFTFLFICSIPLFYYIIYLGQPKKLHEFIYFIYEFIPGSTICFIILVISFTSNRFKRIRQKIKSEFMVDIISSTFKDAKYAQKAPDDFINEIRKFSIVPSPSFESSVITEDYIEGVIENTHIKGCEVNFHEYRTVRDSKGENKKETVTLFNGIAILANIKKNFKGYIEIIENTSSGHSYKYTPIPESLQKVSLESPEFTKLFRVNATDQIQSRYILTPSFMMRVVELVNKTNNGKFNSERMLMAFRNKQLLIMIPTESHFFEIESVLEELTMEKLAKVIQDDLTFVNQIINSVEVDNKSYS